MNLNFTKSGSHAEYGCQDIGEAVSVLYSEMTIMLESRDILCLRRRRLKSMRKAKKVWMHNPLHGIGHRDEHGKQIYNTPEMDGLMELHVFARLNIPLYTIVVKDLALSNV